LVYDIKKEAKDEGIREMKVEEDIWANDGVRNNNMENTQEFHHSYFSLDHIN
jgi:hypothetical protein